MLIIIRNTFKKALFFWLFIFQFSSGFTTTIIPFSHLGEVALEVECIVLAQVIRHYEYKEFDKTRFRTLLSVEESLKGELDAGSLFEVQKWKMKIGELTRVMWGDIELQEGKNYLLFLSKQGEIYHPVCFSYYIYEVISTEGLELLVPSEESHTFHLTGKEQFEPLYSYPKKALLSHMKDVIDDRISWNSQAIRIDFERPLNIQHRAAPGHCSFLGGGNRFRWLNFPGNDLPVHYQSSGDAECSHAIGHVRDAIDTLNSYYTGISISDGGTFSEFVPDCGTSAQGSNLPEWINSNFGDSRHVIIQFNDPCDAIPPLNGCSGTLAIGGLYGIGSHIYDGNTWVNGAYGYVVVNNGVGSCMCSMSTFGSMITHELTHALGIGHISSSSGSANMNPLCCNPVANLDMDCLNYVYQASILPVELSDFSGESLPNVNHLQWTTASEINVDKFVLERSGDLKSESFIAIGEHVAIGNESGGTKYDFIDYLPNEINYYRLISHDHDGSSQISKILTMKRDQVAYVQVYPTLTREKVYIQMPGKLGITQLCITNARGQIVENKNLANYFETVEISDLPIGIYVLRLSYPGGTKVYKIQKI